MSTDWLPAHLDNSSAVSANGMVPVSSYSDIATFVLCLALLVLTLNVARNRRNFHSIIQALFLPRVRSQFFRENKLYNEWCFYLGVIFNTLVQSLLVFYLIIILLPAFAGGINLKVLYSICFGATLFDFFFKLGNTTLLGKLFECSNDAVIFNHSKFFYLSDTSVVLMPILAATIYLGMPAILFVFLLFFITVYVMMVVRTLTLKSSALSLFQFFLYFCTLEILPYLIILKLLTMLR